MPAEQLRIEDALETEGVYVGTTVGTSMWPMLRDRRDTIVVRKPARRLRPGDVALYHSNGKYVLHRVLRVRPEGYVIRGDNCTRLEQVAEQQVIGVLEGFYRGEHEVDMAGWGYRAYVRVWCSLVAPPRSALARVRARLARTWVGDAWRALRRAVRGRR